ncbi:MAG: hypothetical protein CMK59_08590 [Proteobacteria bacterium]|nr:hypothetical protein [Pseudomonadota bacterium]
MALNQLDPKKYKLSSRTTLRQNDAGDVFIVIDRKSRLIMKDGRRITEQAQNIQAVEDNVQVSVLTSAPVCSKTRKFLEEKGISVQPL